MKLQIGSDIYKQSNGIYSIKNLDWLEKQRVAGKVAAGALNLLEKEVNNQTSLTSKQLSLLAKEFILDNKCTPTFENFHGFPAPVCISVNNELVHGIPKDLPFNDGDVISFDLGATFQGAIADTAITIVYGKTTPEIEKLLKIGKECLDKAILVAKPKSRAGDIGAAIFKHAKNNGFNVINTYGGHGIDWDKPHAYPFIPNKANNNEGVILSKDMTIAIEPLLIPFDIDPETKTGSDKWTVYTKSISCHFEHTIYIHENSVEVITDRSNL